MDPVLLQREKQQINMLEAEIANKQNQIRLINEEAIRREQQEAIREQQEAMKNELMTDIKQDILELNDRIQVEDNFRGEVEQNLVNFKNTQREQLQQENQELNEFKEFQKGELREQEEELIMLKSSIDILRRNHQKLKQALNVAESGNLDEAAKLKAEAMEPVMPQQQLQQQGMGLANRMPQAAEVESYTGEYRFTI